MEARVHGTTAEFRDAAWPLIAADPIKHTVILTATAHPTPDALMITLHDNGNLVGAVMRSDPYPLVVSAMPAYAVEFTANTVHEMLPSLEAVSGPVDLAKAFAGAWTNMTGTTATRTLATRLFKLGELKAPELPGAARTATENDMPLLLRWYDAFLTETLPPPAKHIDRAVWARRTLQPGAVTMFWEVDGTPVAMASARGPVASMTRVAPVYTPAEHRGHGYASAITAAVTQWALDQDSTDVLIFTDLTNPTTNHIYPAIGYEPVGDSAEYRFTPTT